MNIFLRVSLLLILQGLNILIRNDGEGVMIF